HALVGVVAAVADVDRLLDVAAFGFLADFVLEAAPPAGGSFVVVVVCAITPAGVVCGPDPLLVGAAVVGVRPAAEAQELQQLAVRERLEPLAEGPATGYLERTGVYEVTPITDEVEALPLACSSADEIGGAAVKEGMLQMRADSLPKAARGITPIEEIPRITSQRTF
ncbi:MAG: hypothetical protein M3272_05910, partial [Actinomycetota bacterium]|nr:hypothetical protein [Actinomycetota bacterium]MDQ3926505.1 hypothetical protein [Actinomycetota bacterium]